MVRRVPWTGGEKESLHTSLDRHRDVVLWKIDGVGDADVRRPMTPSGTSLLGLVKHLAAVEYLWFCQTFGRQSDLLPSIQTDETGDMTDDLVVQPDETTADVVAFYRRARAAADPIITEVDLDETGPAWDGGDVSMRWVLIHMSEETARHAGHMDYRQRADRRRNRRPRLARRVTACAPGSGRKAQEAGASRPRRRAARICRPRRGLGAGARGLMAGRRGGEQS